MGGKELVGTWRLVSAEYKAVDSSVSTRVIYPYDREPEGYLVYSEDGYMSVAVMSKDRGAFASGDRLGGTTEEKVRAADAYLSYCGSYELRGNRVVHHIKVSLFPNWVGTDQERLFELADDTLMLSTTPFLFGGAMRIGQLIWKRVEPVFTGAK